MDTVASPSGYSAEVQLRLVIGERVLPLAQVGPDRIVLRESADCPPTAAEIVMHVDGRERRWPVYLPDGISPTCKITPIR